MSPDPVHPHSVPRRQWASEGSGAATAGPDDEGEDLGWEIEEELEMPAWKRNLDLVCVVSSAVVLAPLMAAIALWVKLVSRGPVLFRQERVGLGGQTFTLFKFRSMKVSAATSSHEDYVEKLIESDRPMTKMDELGDARLIPGGCLLRALGLDELPQLINVARGEMSLVGPRPCLPREARRYSPEQRKRFHTVPGLTGHWQVSGKNRTTFSEMVAMDIDYARNRSLRRDLQIILRTPFSILGQLVASYMKESADHRAPESPAAADREHRGTDH